VPEGSIEGRESGFVVGLERGLNLVQIDGATKMHVVFVLRREEMRK
jgi:hypothetical protein